MEAIIPGINTTLILVILEWIECGALGWTKFSILSLTGAFVIYIIYKSFKKEE